MSLHCFLIYIFFIEYLQPLFILNGNIAFRVNLLARPSKFLYSLTMQQADHQLLSSFLVHPPRQFQTKSSLFCFSYPVSCLTRSQSFEFFHLSVRLVRSKPQPAALCMSWCCHFTFHVCTSSNLQAHTCTCCFGDRQYQYLWWPADRWHNPLLQDVPFLLLALDYAPALSACPLGAKVQPSS